MTTAYKPVVTVDGRGSILIVLRESDAVPAFIHGLVTREGIARENVRFAVGCKGIDAKIAEAFNPYVLDSLEVKSGGKVIRTTTGSFWSGGTANADANGILKDDMPTVLPGLIAARYPTVAFSSTPKTAKFIAQNYHNGGLLPSDYETRLDYRQHLNIVFEPGIDVAGADWDTDVPLYIQLQDGWDKVGITTGLLNANGGAIALLEFVRGIEKRRRSIFVKGSGRECDAVIAGLENGNFDLIGVEQRNVFIGKRDKAGATPQQRDAMQAKIDTWDKTVAVYKASVAAADHDFIRIVNILDVDQLNRAWLDLGFLQDTSSQVEEDPNAKTV